MLLCKRARLCESIYMPSLCLCVCVSAACVRGWMWCLQRQKEKKLWVQGLFVLCFAKGQRQRHGHVRCPSSIKLEVSWNFYPRQKKTRVATALLAVKALWKHTFGLRGLLPCSASRSFSAPKPPNMYASSSFT